MELRKFFTIATLIVVMLAAPVAAEAQQAVRIPRMRGEAGVSAGVPVWHGANTFEFIAAGPAFGGEVVKDAPYSAEAVTETQQILADGNKISRTTTSKIYRDSQGRTRREQQINAIGPWSAAGEPREIVFINDPVEGVHYVLNTNDRTAQKTEVEVEVLHQKIGELAADLDEANRKGSFDQPESAAGGPRIYGRIEREVKQGQEGELHDVTVVHSAAGMDVHFPGHNAETESLGKRMIEGVEAEGVRTTTTIPAGEIGNERPIEIVSERWYSPHLKTVVLSKHSDPRMGETTYRLANIQLVEPLSMLFEVPPGYEIQESNERHFFQRHLLPKGENGAGR